MFLKSFKLNLYSEKCTCSVDSSNALHIAGRKGLTRLTKAILSEGNFRLLWAQDSSGSYPVELAIKECHYSTAVIMLKAMNDRLA